MNIDEKKIPDNEPSRHLKLGWRFIYDMDLLKPSEGDVVTVLLF